MLCYFVLDNDVGIYILVQVAPKEISIEFIDLRVNFWR